MEVSHEEKGISEELATLERARTPRQIALLRIRVLSEKDLGLATIIATLLNDALESFTASRNDDDDALFHGTAELLRRFLRLYLHLNREDVVLGEELALEDSHHVLLSELIECDISASATASTYNEARQDVLMELQDLACEIVACAKKFSRTAVPCADLKTRLPLIFAMNVQATDRIFTTLIHQVTSRQSAQVDVGFVMWPSAVVLARWIVAMEPFLIQQNDDGTAKRVIELGAGCGLSGIVAALVQAQKQPVGGKYESRAPPCVLLTDFNPLVLDNLKRNIALNDLSDVCGVAGLDFYDQAGTSDKWKDMKGFEREPVDVVVAADIICETADAKAAAKTIHDVLRPGGSAFVVCANAAHRFGVDHFAKACQRVNLAVSVQEARDAYHGKLLVSEDLHQTAGYIEGMSLTMFTIQKPTL